MRKTVKIAEYEPCFSPNRRFPCPRTAYYYIIRIKILDKSIENGEKLWYNTQIVKYIGEVCPKVMRTEARMDSGINMFGYSCRVKLCGVYMRRCVLTVLLWVIICIVNVFAALWMQSPAAIVLALFIEIPLVILTAPVFKQEYDYEIEDGTLTVARISGGSRRREVAEIPLRKVILVAPMNNDVLRKCENERPARTVDVTSGAPDADEAVMLYPDEKGRLTMLLFDANERFFRAARFYCPSAVSRF